jgi:hypothetical protein
MKKMGRYLKAYPIERLREFPGWSAANDAGDRPYVYLQENYTVTQGIFLDEDIVFDRVTPEWTSFCQERLGFQTPPAHTAPSSSEGRQ